MTTVGASDNCKMDDHRDPNVVVVSDKAVLNENIVDEYNNPQRPTEYVSYRSRWYLLFTVMVINFANALIWIMFSPVTDKTAKYYNISFMEVNWLSLIFLVTSVPSGFVASWLLDTIGLQASIICSSVLNLLGSILRNLTIFSFMPVHFKFPILIVGQTIAAIGQTFIIFTPAKAAGLWFSDSQRAIATTLASMANPLGIMVANILSPALVKSDDDIGKMLWVCTGTSAFGFLLSILGLVIHSSVPPTPPSASAAVKSESFFNGLRKLKSNKHFWYLAFVVGGGLALFTSFTTFLEQILCPRNYSNDFAGLCGALMIGIGILGAIVTGVIVDITKKFDEIVKIGFCLSNLFAIAFVQVSRYRDQKALVAITAALFGGFGFAVYPVSLELAVEISYPVAEATSTGLTFLSGQLQGIILMLASQYTAQPLSAHEGSLNMSCPKDGEFDPEDWTYPNLGANFLGVIYVIVLVLLFKPQYRRMSVENQMKNARPVQRNATPDSDSGPTDDSVVSVRALQHSK